MATEHFCLRWNNHQSTLVSVFDNLLESGTLVDCTLAADGRYLKAHKVVLSACSPYLGMLLSQHYDKHPIIILKDVKFDELKAMLDYMYRGEVNISQEQLSTFLKAAETLQIKGLTDAGSDEGNGLQPNRPPSSNSTTSANEDPQSPGPPGDGGSSPGPRKRKRNKHGDDGEGDSVSKISLSEGSDRLSGTSVGSPSAKSASVKREPADGEGDGQLSVDDSGEVVMMSRPGPSNGGTNNKAPWILSADSSGEEMQLTPGQDGRPRGVGLADQEIKKDLKNSGTVPKIKEKEIKQEVEDQFEGETNVWEEEKRSGTSIQNPRIFYRITRSENELIIPDPLEEPPSLVYLPHDYQSSAKSVYSTDQRDNYKSDRSNGEGHIFEDTNDCDQSVQKLPFTVEQPVVEGPSKEESMRRVRERLKTVQLIKVPNSLYIKPSISQSSSVTVIDLNENPQTQLKLPSQFCLRSSSQSSSSSETSSKTVDTFDKKKLRVKKTKLDLHTPKYRKILPAPEDNSSISVKGTKIVQNVAKSTIPNTVEKQSVNSPRCSVSPSNVPAGSIVESTSVQPNNTYNQHQTQSGLLNNTSSTTSVISIPQQIQVGQIGNPNPSLISIPQPLQGSQIINNTPNMLSIPQEVQASRINNSSATLLSIAPQFSIPSSIQTGNIQMQLPNNSAGNFQNTQFFGNGDGSHNQVLSNQNGVLTHQSQAVSHPVFVTSNIISSCQASNQFLPSTSVQYNFSSPSLQPNFCVPTSQSNLNHATSQPSIISSTPASTTSTSSENKHSIYVRTPSGFVEARFTSPVGQAANNTPFLRGRGIVPSSQRGRGIPPSERGRGPTLLPKNKLILPKK